MPELRPCPFCGGKAHLCKDQPGGRLWHVSCGRCYVMTVNHGRQDAAVVAWNRRVSNPGKPESEEGKKE